MTVTQVLDLAFRTTGRKFASPMRNWHLARNFLHREIQNRYVGSFSGMLWALLHPMLLLAVFAFVFNTVFRPPELREGNYLTFVAVALWPWLAFQEGLLRGTGVIQNYAGLIKKVAFRHELLVYASVTATFSLQLVGYIIVLVVLQIAGAPIHWSGLPLAALLWVILLLGTIGFAFVFSAMQVFMRDVEHGLSSTMQVFLYLAPILYPLSLVPAALRPWVEANPFSYLAGRMRDALISGHAMPSFGDAIALAVALLTLLAGRAFFLRLSPFFEDFV